MSTEIFIGNIFQYIAPLFLIVINDLKFKRQEHILNILSVFAVVAGSTFLFLPQRRLFFGIPTYLLTFYWCCWLALFLFEHKGGLGNPIPSFLIVYTASYLWEVPIFLYDFIKNGFHFAIVLHTIGAYSYVYLYKLYKPNKKIMLVTTITPIIFTAIIMAFFPIYEEGPFTAWIEPSEFGLGALLMIPCRVVAIVCLAVWRFLK